MNNLYNNYCNIQGRISFDSSGNRMDSNHIILHQYRIKGLFQFRLFVIVFFPPSIIIKISTHR